MAATTADRITEWLTEHVMKPCAIAGFFVLVAFLWTLLFQHEVAYPLLFLFIGAVMGAAWFGGIVAGFIAVGLSSLLVDYFFVPPFFSMTVAVPSQTYLVAFVVCAIAMTLVSAAQRRSQNAVRDARDQLEAKVQERTAELQQTNLELAAAHDELSRLSRMMSMGELAASIAHELNQPLTAVVTHAYACRTWLSAEPANLEKAVATADKIVQESTRAGAVVARVRALFRKDDTVREATDLNRLIADLARVLREDAMRRKVSLRLALAPELPRVELDQVQIQQVLLNLAMNGMDAMADAGEPRVLTIRSEMQAENEICVTVEDRGTGVTEDAARRMFEPFFTTKPQGIGMGLAICRSIVEGHDGRIWATEAAGGGAALHFTLRVNA
ncbi:MAG TPA: ATP-binding protein [Acidobacteriaceae bacterium]|jgi:C4-dicarboxylate-specific signal transduction histidine kinase